MTPRDRVICALEHRDPDITPWSIDLTLEERRRIVEYTGDPDIEQTFGSHIVGMSFGSMEQIPERPDYYIDHFGVVWNRTVDKDIGIVDQYQLKAPDIDAVKPLIPAFDTAMHETRMTELMERPESLFRIANLGFSLFERAWTLRGMDHLLMDMVENPDFVDVLLTKITDWNMQCIEFALKYSIDGMLFGDDWGMQRGTIMGPRFWRKFLKPHLARMYGRIRQAGKFVLQHSCGDISEIYPDLVEIGLHAHQTFQPEIYDIHAIKQRYQGKLAFWGGISTQRLLPFASADEVRSDTARIVEVMGKGGGFIAAPTHAVPPDVPPENVLAMVDTLKKQGNISK